MRNAFSIGIIILISAGWIHAERISVSSPYPMMTWNPGKAYTIRWSPNSQNSQMDATVSIILRQNNAFFRMIINNAPNNGSYPWTIPADIPDGDYVVRVRTNPEQYNQVGGDSGLFKIKPPPAPKIEVYLPNGSSHWLKGQPYSIRWHLTGELHTKVRIKLFNVAETSEIPLFPQMGLISNTGAHTWTVPLSVTPGNYKIRVEDYVNNVTDFSESFEIRGAEKFIAITAPEPWAGLCIGRQRTILWTSGGLQGTVNLELLTLGGKVMGSIAKYIPITQGSFTWKVGRYKSLRGRWYDFPGSFAGKSSLKPNEYYKIKIISPSGGVHVVSKRYLLMRCDSQ